MGNQENTSDSTKLKFIQAASKISIVGSENGFGDKQKHNKYAQDTVAVLKESGDISDETARTINKNVLYRNDIIHKDPNLPVSEEQNKSFQNAVQKVVKIIEEYKTEGKYTEI